MSIPKTQDDLEICDLFINEKFAIPDIVRLTGHDYGFIVQALLRQKAIVDRRQQPRVPLTEVSSN